MASPVSVPLSSFVFTSHWLMGAKATEWNIELIIGNNSISTWNLFFSTGLILVFFGLLVFKSTQSIQRKVIGYHRFNEELKNY